MTLIRSLLIAVLLTASVGATAQVDEGRYSTLQARAVTLEQAIAMVQSRYRAKVMRANAVEEDGRVVYYIRLMTPDRSRVWTVRVDAATGREF
jgi:uncharacterized membrane protein YkoI